MTLRGLGAEGYIIGAGSRPYVREHGSNSALSQSLPDQCTMWQLIGLMFMGTVAWAQQYAGCPEPYGLQTYPHETYCDKFYKCANGRLY